LNKRDFLKYAGLGIGGVGMAWLLDQFRLPGMKPNPYLENNYAPVSEQLFERQLQIVGELPKELNGLYLRNGPNPMQSVNNKKHHWFSGEGMLHGLRLDEGEALWYRNRRTGGANTHVISHANKIYATVEAGGSPVEVKSDLDPTGNKPFEGTLKTGFSAHAKLDSSTGELHAMCYEFPRGSYKVNHVVVGSDGQVKTTRPISLSSRTMMHECAITNNYVLVFDLSVTFSLFKLTRGYFPFSWNDKHQARIGLLNRVDQSKQIQWFNIDPCYLFHVFNAYEDEQGRVIVDALRYERLFDDDWNGPFTEEPPMLTKWLMTPGDGSITEAQKDDLPAEFPRVHPELDGNKHRYGYCLGTGSMVKPDFGRFVKYDFVKDSKEVYELPTHEFGAEPVFIPATNASSEDEGYLISFVYDQLTNGSSVQILNAQQITEGPIAKVILPQRVPYGFHGSWVPA